jgi:molybdopterin converting factor small subunit
MKLTEAKLKELIIEAINEKEDKIDSRYVFKKTFEALGEDVSDENLEQLFAKYKDLYRKALGEEDSRYASARNNDFIKTVDAALNKEWK